MTQEAVNDLVRSAIWTVLMASSPAVGVAMLVGTFIALLQALTQVQESTLSFVPKIVAVLLALLVAADFMALQVGAFTERAYSQIENIGR